MKDLRQCADCGLWRLVDLSNWHRGRCRICDRCAKARGGRVVGLQYGRQALAAYRATRQPPAHR